MRPGRDGSFLAAERGEGTSCAMGRCTHRQICLSWAQTQAAQAHTPRLSGRRTCPRMRGCTLPRYAGYVNQTCAQRLLGAPSRTSPGRFLVRLASLLRAIRRKCTPPSCPGLLTRACWRAQCTHQCPSRAPFPWRCCREASGQRVAATLSTLVPLLLQGRHLQLGTRLEASVQHGPGQSPADRFRGKEAGGACRGMPQPASHRSHHWSPGTRRGWACIRQISRHHGDSSRPGMWGQGRRRRTHRRIPFCPTPFPRTPRPSATCRSP